MEVVALQPERGFPNLSVGGVHGPGVVAYQGDFRQVAHTGGVRGRMPRTPLCYARMAVNRRIRVGDAQVAAIAI